MKLVPQDLQDTSVLETGVMKLNCTFKTVQYHFHTLLS